MTPDRISVLAFDSSFGLCHVASSIDGITDIFLPGSSTDKVLEYLKKSHPLCTIVHEAISTNNICRRQIEEYFSGKRKEFKLQFDLRGSDFQVKVLNEVARIPYGSTRTYGQIAAAIGSPGATRAVGNANARNPLPIIIPCHRVLASNGLGGYGGGIVMKKKLLNLEGALGSISIFD